MFIEVVVAVASVVSAAAWAPNGRRPQRSRPAHAAAVDVVEAAEAAPLQGSTFLPARSAFGDAFEAAVRSALRNETQALRGMLADDVNWAGLEAVVGADASVDRILQSIDLVTDVNFAIYGEAVGSDATVFDWVASATFQNFWAPRVKAYGSSRVVRAAGGAISSVQDNWEKSPSQIFREQVVPPASDVYDLFLTPVAERPCTQPVKAKVPRGFSLVELAPELVVRVECFDRTNSRSLRIASALPDFAFLEDLKTTAVPKNMVTPIVTSVQLVSAPETPEGAAAAKPLRRVRWDVCVPTTFGLDSRKLPELAASETIDDDALRNGWISQPTLAYVTKNKRVALVTTFDGDVQDAAVEQVKQSLLDAAESAALLTSAQRASPNFEFWRNRAKVM
ncbi:hypothetical protein M885DRAFT_552549 [Pelagophyceae sp. CCMP2097]|nr:hypothetical protein M885DRAFT_552549 [Pelagophyceae sp. CCMP2097]